MPTDLRDVLWLNQSETVSITELASLAGLSEEDICELVDVGALAPARPQESPWTFSADCVVTVRKANRLRDDLDLDPDAVALALTLLEQIRTLESELSQVRAQQVSVRRF
jgi:chaperone modulatory protein CbpM